MTGGAPAPTGSRPRGTVRVVVLEDHALIRTALREVLEQDGDVSVVGECATGAEALSLVPALAPAVLVVGAAPSDLVLEVCRRLRFQKPELAVVMISGGPDPELSARALDAGARQVVERQAGGRVLLDAVRRTAAC